jgi:CheY-like chemotaxis protein
MGACPRVVSDRDVDEIDVLVVAPDARLRRHLSDVISSGGYRVEEVEDLFPAFERIRTRSVGAIVLGPVEPLYEDGLLRMLHGMASPPIVMFRSSSPSEHTPFPVEADTSGEGAPPLVSVDVLFQVDTALAAGGWRGLRDHRRPRRQGTDSHEEGIWDGTRTSLPS